mmetsp:Transcript_23337/g.40385  ORF Transcript_23337/g.40385 Transcript_23337/m.40385 type:complete len:205 (+) Transcript_23337:1532-2146(+)
MNWSAFGLFFAPGGLPMRFWGDFAFFCSASPSLLSPLTSLLLSESLLLSLLSRRSSLSDACLSDTAAFLPRFVVVLAGAFFGSFLETVAPFSLAVALLRPPLLPRAGSSSSDSLSLLLSTFFFADFEAVLVDFLAGFVGSASSEPLSDSEDSSALCSATAFWFAFPRLTGALPALPFEPESLSVLTGGAATLVDRRWLVLADVS